MWSPCLQVIPLAITNFGNKLLQALCKTTGSGENVLISPLNIYASLALAHLGAAGTTRNELQQNVFGISVNENEYVLLSTNLVKIQVQ